MSETTVIPQIEEETASDDAAELFGDNFHNLWLILRGSRQSLFLFLESFDYLGPLRSAPQRFYYVAGQGSGTPERGKQFVRSLVRASAASFDALNGWLAATSVPYRMELQPVDERKALYELRLQEVLGEKKAGVSANIREVGFGLTQMLPIIAQAVLAKPGDTLIIEQPELHLHPRAQTNLANLFIALAQQGINCIIETHSEHLLLRLQKQIAKTTVGNVDPEKPGEMLLRSQLGVYFVNRKTTSTVTKIEIGPYGDLLSTPDGFEDFFSDDMFETAERMRARLGQRRSAG